MSINAHQKINAVLKLSFVLLMLFGIILYTSYAGDEATKSATLKQYVELQENELKYTADGREFLAYIVECALPESVVVYFELDGKRYEFPGAMALAPRWLENSLTESEARWVSACILARTNFFGEKVEISMRAEHSNFKALRVSDDERRDFTVYEGDFWGNLFADDPVAYACAGERTAEQDRNPILQKRVCTEIDATASAADLTVTRCGFILSGKCSAIDMPESNVVKYDEYISVYLKPEKNHE